MLDELLMHMNPPLLKDKAKRFKDFSYLTQVIMDWNSFESYLLT